MGLQLTTQQLEYLVAIEAADTWAEAAAAVGVTPSALSQGVAELERRLGMPLFSREGRRRVPTRDHPEVLRYARRTVAATYDLARWLAQRRAGERGSVRLGMIDAAATVHCRDVLLSFRAARPDVELHLQVAPSADLLDRLTRAELDLVVCVGSGVSRDDVSEEPLLEESLAVLAPKGDAVDDPAGWGPWVSFPTGSHTRARVAEALHALGARFEVVAESHQPEVLRDMVALGIGWTVLPASSVAAHDGVAVVRDTLTTRPLVLARRPAAPPDGAVDALARLLRTGRP